MAFWKCYYHIVWTTKHRQPLISPHIEQIVYRTIRDKSRELACDLLAINGTENHIHTAVMVPPKLSVAKWVADVKGSSSRRVNQVYPDELNPFHWQRSYGVVTFGAKVLPFVIAYVTNQKSHHAEDMLEPYLEQTGEDTDL